MYNKNALLRLQQYISRAAFRYNYNPGMQLYGHVTRDGAVNVTDVNLIGLTWLMESGSNPPTPAQFKDSKYFFGDRFPKGFLSITWEPIDLNFDPREEAIEILGLTDSQADLLFRWPPYKGADDRKPTIQDAEKALDSFIKEPSRDPWWHFCGKPALWSAYGA